MKHKPPYPHLKAADFSCFLFPPEQIHFLQGFHALRNGLWYIWWFVLKLHSTWQSGCFEELWELQNNTLHLWWDLTAMHHDCKEVRPRQLKKITSNILLTRSDQMLRFCRSEKSLYAVWSIIRTSSQFFHVIWYSFQCDTFSCCWNTGTKVLGCLKKN